MRYQYTDIAVIKNIKFYKNKLYINTNMNFVYDLKDNYQFILDNLDTFTPEDLYISNIAFFNFCNEYYYSIVEENLIILKLLN